MIPTNAFIYLIGPPGVGKLTVGRIIAARLKAKLIDNHYWINPILELVPHDGISPVHSQMWHYAALVRSAVLGTIEHLSPADCRFVFTHAAVGSPADLTIAGQILSVAKARRAPVLIALLSCSSDELARRVANPERLARHKEIDVSAAIVNATLPPFNPGFGLTVKIDTTDKTAGEVAKLIIEDASKLEPTRAVGGQSWE